MNCARLVGHDLGDLEKHLGERARKAARSGWRPEVETVVAGQVVGLRKKGDSQMFVQIEDGRGRLECAFFAETYNEFAAMLARDRLLVIQGGLREDASAAASRCAPRAAGTTRRSAPSMRSACRCGWTCAYRAPGQRVDALLAQAASRRHPLRLDLLRAGAAGMLDLNGTSSVRVDADLPGALRAHAGRARGEAGVLEALVELIDVRRLDHGVATGQKDSPVRPRSLSDELNASPRGSEARR